MVFFSHISDHGHFNLYGATRIGDALITSNATFGEQAKIQQYNSRPTGRNQNRTTNDAHNQQFSDND
jgi:hypothetical protein